MTLHVSRLSPKERQRLDDQLKAVSKYRRINKGTIPPLALLPLFSYLPKEWTYQMVGKEGWLAETLRELHGAIVIETPWSGADATIGYTERIEDVDRAYATNRAFALLMPITMIGEPGHQRYFQSKGMTLMTLDHKINDRALAWFLWALPNVRTEIIYGHVPDPKHLAEWWVRPTSREMIRKGIQFSRLPSGV